MIPILYVLIAIISWPILSAVMLRHFQSEFRGDLDTTDVAAAVAIGLLLAPLWPLTALIALGTYTTLRLLHAIQTAAPEDEDDPMYQHPSKR